MKSYDLIEDVGYFGERGAALHEVVLAPKGLEDTLHENVGRSSTSNARTGLSYNLLCIDI